MKENKSRPVYMWIGGDKILLYYTSLSLAEELKLYRSRL